MEAGVSTQMTNSVAATLDVRFDVRRIDVLWQRLPHAPMFEPRPDIHLRRRPVPRLYTASVGSLLSGSCSSARVSIPAAPSAPVRSTTECGEYYASTPGPFGTDGYTIYRRPRSPQVFLLPGALGMVGVTTGSPQSGVCLARDSKVRLLSMSAPQAGVQSRDCSHHVPLAISMHSAARKCTAIIDYMLRCCAVSRDVQTWSTKPHSFASAAVMNRSRSRVCSTSS